MQKKKLGMIYNRLGSVCSFLNWEGADVQAKENPCYVLVVVGRVSVVIKS